MSLPNIVPLGTHQRFHPWGPTRWWIQDNKVHAWIPAATLSAYNNTPGMLGLLSECIGIDPGLGVKYQANFDWLHRGSCLITLDIRYCPEWLQGWGGDEPVEPVPTSLLSPCRQHTWANTGMAKTWCTAEGCQANGRWDGMEIVLVDLNGPGSVA